MARFPVKRLASVALIACGCAGGEEGDGAPGAAGSAGSIGVGASAGWAGNGDGGSLPDAGSAGGGGVSSGGSGGSGGGSVPLPCDSRFWTPKVLTAGKPFNVKFTDTTGYAYVDVVLSGPGQPTATWAGVTGSGPYTWTHLVTGHAQGVLTMQFVKDKTGGAAGTVVATCQKSIGPGTGGTGGTGSGGANSGGTGGSGPSCGELAGQNNWPNAACEKNGNNACSGMGPATWDCDHCCQVGGSGGTGGGSGGTTGFGYPVGDKTSPPAGGWAVWQVLGHYWSDYGGRHLAQDVSHPSGGVSAINAPVYSVADGTVVYARSNTSSYVNVIAIKHPIGGGKNICSFYGHIHQLKVQKGQPVSRGQQIAQIIDWNVAAGGKSSNSHLHYVLLSEAACDKSVNYSLCGYDKGDSTIGLPRTDTSKEPYYYTSVNDACGSWVFQNAFISPTKFIQDNHY